MHAPHIQIVGVTLDQQLIDLFERLSSPLDVKSKLVTPRQPETNHLEFKEKSDSRVPDLGKDDKRNFSKALSAFSNADGGVLIWGIRTKVKDGRDVAWTPKPISQVQDMAERLRSSLLDVLMPQNPSIRIEAISNRLGNGFVKCLIPPSDAPPHRAMVDREYWARLDGRSVRLEHYMIRDMMLRHAYPDIQFSAVVRRGVTDTHIDIEFRMLNTGRAVAKYAGWYGSIQNALIVSSSHLDQISRQSGIPNIFWNAPPGVVIHPNGIHHAVGRLALRFINPDMPISMLTKTYCEGMTTKEMPFVFRYPDSDAPIWQLGG